MFGGHSGLVPLLPIPNRTVKRTSADDSTDSRVKVGHRQTSYLIKAHPKRMGFGVLGRDDSGRAKPCPYVLVWGVIWAGVNPVPTGLVGVIGVRAGVNPAPTGLWCVGV